MDLNEIEALIDRAKRQPLTTFLVISVIAIALATGAWITSFFGEMGKHQATPQQSNPKPINKQSGNAENGKKSSEESISASADDKLQSTDSIRPRSSDQISEALNRIIENQREIIDRLSHLENNISSDIADLEKINTELLQLGPLLKEMVSFLRPDGQLSNELEGFADKAKIAYRNAENLSNHTLSVMWKKREEKVLKLRDEINDKYAQALSLSRDLEKTQGRIQMALKVGMTSSEMESLQDLYSNFKDLYKSINPVIANVTTADTWVWD